MFDYDYRETDREELKELKRQHFRTVCRIKNLEANIARVAPDGFDPLMAELEAQMQKAEVLCSAIFQYRYREMAEDLENRKHQC